MKKSLFGLIVLFILLTTYTPKFNFIENSNLYIQKIEIENTYIVRSDQIKKNLRFLYKENLFFLNLKDIEKNLKQESFVESFSIKKIYPNTLKIIIAEKKPIAILHNKKEKFYISNKGDLIDFIDIKIYKDLPTVFGNGESFYSLYQDLQNIRFPLERIKSFYKVGETHGLVLRLAESRVEKRIEQLIYPIESFVSEFGGALGLFLGFSFLMIWDLLSSSWFKIRNCFYTLENKEL